MPPLSLAKPTSTIAHLPKVDRPYLLRRHTLLRARRLSAIHP